MRDTVQLRLDRLSDMRMPVTVDAGPNRRVAVNVIATVVITHHGSLSADNDERLVLWSAPFLHRRKGMPEMGFIEADEVVGGGHGKE